MSTFFVFYYAMGWLTEGFNFALIKGPKNRRCPYWWASILFWPVVLPAYIVAYLDDLWPRLPRGKEYLWRRKP